MQGAGIRLLLILILTISINSAVFSQDAVKKTADKKTGSDKKGDAGEKTNGNTKLADQLKKDKKLRLTVKKVIEYLISNNHDIKSALIAYKGTSIGLLNFNSKFDPYLTSSYMHGKAQIPNKSQQLFAGKSTDYDNYWVGLSKSFNTGTRIDAGLINGQYQDVNGSLLASSGFQTGVSVQLSQELLKNCFGISDRLTESMIANSARLNRGLIRMKLSGLMVEALIGYWNVAIAEEGLKTSEVNLKSTTEIRNLVINKAGIGLSEREEILDWNVRVLQSSNFNEKMKKLLFDTRLAVLRVLNFDSDFEIEVGATFTSNPPDVNVEEAMKDAFIKREDWNNQNIALKNAEMEYRAAYNNLLPSLRFKVGVGNKDYSSRSFTGSVNTLNPEYNIGLDLVYPIGDRAADARLRQARLGIQNESVNKSRLEKAIRDEIVSIVKQCEVDYKIYQQTRKVRENAQNYYTHVLAKFRMGKYNALQLKLALDGYINSRQAELQSQVDYNISLIRRDLARNVIFEKLDVDINQILKRLEDSK
ncbi:MAG: TolC family protein [Spirochaetes bacterium]|jgi:hypothetical protein|nr:TolC family protein [Spirochaetota bacterium]